MSGADWREVGRVLLGSWPSQVAAWDREAVAAYVRELQARSLTPGEAVQAIRQHQGAFPPSASEVASAATVDPGRPTFIEAFRMIYGAGGVMSARSGGGVYSSELEMLAATDGARVDRAWKLHPLLGAFVEAYGARRLAMLEVDHEDHGALVRRDLEREWERHVDAYEHREAAQIAAGRRQALQRPGPRRLDPARTLGITVEASDPIGDGHEF